MTASQWTRIHGDSIATRTTPAESYTAAGWKPVSITLVPCCPCSTGRIYGGCERLGGICYPPGTFRLESSAPPPATVPMPAPSPSTAPAEPSQDAPQELIPAEELAMPREDRPTCQQNQRRLARRLAVLPLALLLSASTAFATPPAKPHARPTLTVTVKVCPASPAPCPSLPTSKLFALSTVTRTSCTAWIATDETSLWLAAIDACRAALARKGGAK